MHRSAGRAVLIGAVIVLGSATAAAAARVAGNVGGYRFSTGTATGQSVSCGFSRAALSKITEQSPLVKMRAYWTQPHDGRVADAQYVGFAATLSGERGNRWTTLATHQRYTLVGKSWKRMPALGAFTPSAGLRGGYDQYRIREKLTWLRPTDNRSEGSVTVAMAHYHDGSAWRSSCVRAHPAIRTTSLPTAHIGQAYAAALAASGVGPFSWSRVTGSLQDLTLSSSGRLAGTPATSPGRSTVTIRVRDGNGLTASRSFPLAVGYATGDVNGDGAVTCADVNVIDANRGGANRTHLQGDLTGDGKVDDADETVFANAYRGVGCPVTGFSVQTNTNGSSIVWSVGLDPNGRAVHVHAVNNHGGTWDWDTGATLWRSPTVTDTIGYAANDTVTVTVTAVGRTTLNASASANTAATPPPSISLSVGSSVTRSDCPTRCAYFFEMFNDFPAGTYRLQCNNARGDNFFTGNIAIAGGNSTHMGPCYEQSGYAMPVSVTVYGVPYNGGTITIRSNNASW